MKKAIVGDIHFGYGKNSEVFLQTTINFFKYLLKYCLGNDIKEIYFLGDIFDPRTKIDVRTMKIARDLFKEIIDSGLHVKIIVGNHDLYYQNSNEIDSLFIFDDIIDDAGGIHVIREPYKNKATKETFIPWIIDYDNVKDFGSGNVLYGHFDSVGFNYNRSSLFNCSLFCKLKSFSNTISTLLHPSSFNIL